MKYKVINISDRDYGCEGIPDGQELLCEVLLADENGHRITKEFPDRYLRENSIEEGSVINL